MAKDGRLQRAFWRRRGRVKASLLVMVSRMYNAIVFRALSEAVVNKYNVALANDIEFYP